MQIQILRTPEHCPLCDLNLEEYPRPSLVADLFEQKFEKLPVCVHHEAHLLEALGDVYVYTPVAVGDIKGIVTQKDVEPVLPDLPAHVYPQEAASE